MKKILTKILFNAITFEILSMFVYTFYCLVFAMAAMPSFFIVSLNTYLLNGIFVMKLIFILICFISLYIFWICAALLVGFTERLLTLGFKEGYYSTNSITFLRWLINSGLHLWALYLVLPFLQGSNWIKIYLRVAGAKIGKNVFINTRLINDSYLLEIEDDVVIGGDAVITCHIFENGNLILGKILLREGVSIGANSYITPGAKINKKSKIGILTKLQCNTVVAEGTTIMSLPGMNLRQIVKVMRFSEASNGQSISKNRDIAPINDAPICQKNTLDVIDDSNIMLEEYKIICSYITSRDALRWTILGTGIGAYGLILAKLIENPEWNLKTLALLLFGGFILSVATVQNTRLYEYCKVARRRAVALEQKLNITLFREYKGMKMIGMKVNEIPKSTGWLTASLPIIGTTIAIAYLWLTLGVPSL